MKHQEKQITLKNEYIYIIDHPTLRFDKSCTELGNRRPSGITVDLMWIVNHFDCSIQRKKTAQSQFKLPDLHVPARAGVICAVGCFGLNGPLRQYFSLYRGGRQRRERIDESKSVQTTPTRTYCKRSRPLPYCNQNCRTPRHWKFTQHHRTTQPPPICAGRSCKS